MKRMILTLKISLKVMKIVEHYIENLSFVVFGTLLCSLIYAPINE